MALLNTGQKLGFLNVIVVILSFYVLGALLVDTFVKLPEETSILLNYIDDGICAIFFLEFCTELYRAERKWEYLRWGWVDLISCIPMIDALRFGRVLRLIKLLRIIKAFRSTRRLVEYLFRNKAQGALTSVSVVAILLVIFSAIAILQVEDDPESNIKTAEDAIWWAYVTVTTVGYGDKFPVTTEGRAIAALLMAAGVGLFGTFTAFATSLFVKEQSNTENSN